MSEAVCRYEHIFNSHDIIHSLHSIDICCVSVFHFLSLIPLLGGADLPHQPLPPDINYHGLYNIAFDKTYWSCGF